jgi:hypothetical protein
MKRNDIVENTEDIRDARGFVVAGARFYVTIADGEKLTVRLVSDPSRIFDNVSASAFRLI